MAHNILQSAGYTSSVITINIFNTIIVYSKLCHVFDFCAANCHAFFNSNIVASDASNFVKNQANRVFTTADNKKIVITKFS